MSMKQWLLAGTVMAAMVAAGAGFAKDWDDNGHPMPVGTAGQQCHHDDGAHALLNLLPDDKRKLLHETMEKIHKENASLREQAHALYGQLETMMKAPTFDKKAFLETQAELDDVRAKMKKNAEKEFASAASTFNVEERKILVELYKLKHHHHHMDGEHHEEQQDKES